MLLAYCCFGTVMYIVEQLSAEWQRNLIALNIVRALLVNQKEMIIAVSPCKVCVFTDFDIAFCTEDKEANIAPGVQAVVSKPIHTDIACSIGASQYDIPEIFQFRVFSMVKVCDLCRNNIRLGTLGEIEKGLSDEWQDH